MEQVNTAYTTFLGQRFCRCFGRGLIQTQLIIYKMLTCDRNTTYNALLSVFPGKRPFIIGRSTSVGSGTKAGHWGGDNRSLFLYMAMSIPQALQMSLFGIPFFGVDTCGFDGNSDSELCSRWMQLSAFFPFYRNHNTLSANPQEPYGTFMLDYQFLNST